MELLILGATGRTGRKLVEQASRRGHRVRAFVRAPQELDAEIIEGDPSNASDLRAAMRGCEAVISALGPPLPPQNWPRPSTILGDAAKATVEAMAATGTRRLLVISGDLQFPDRGVGMAILRATLLRHLARDQAEMERVVQSSGLDWTIVRPTRLVDGDLGSYRAEDGRLPSRARAIPRADVAQFLVDAVERGDHIRKLVGLAR